MYLAKTPKPGPMILAIGASGAARRGHEQGSAATLPPCVATLTIGSPSRTKNRSA